MKSYAVNLDKDKNLLLSLCFNILDIYLCMYTFHLSMHCLVSESQNHNAIYVLYMMPICSEIS